MDARSRPWASSKLRSPVRAGGSWLVVVLALLCSEKARAYCRTSSCADCPRDEQGCIVGGTPIAWSGRCVALGIHVDASQWADFDAVQALTEQAFATWNAVRCEPSGLPPSIELRGTHGPIVCGRSEYVGGAANANILVFRDETWPYSADGSELASTLVRSRADGTLIDSDIEINGTRPLLVGDEQGQGTLVGAHDLLSILTHEMGHLLGLDHSSDPDSIMQITLPPRVIRTQLGDDDIAAICAAYPPERDAPPCDPTPRGAFSPQCALDPSTGGACSAVQVGAKAARAAHVAWSLSTLVCLLGLRWQRRKRLTQARAVSGAPAVASRASTASDRDAPGSRPPPWLQR